MKSIFSMIKNRLIQASKRRDHFSGIKFHFYYGLHNYLLRYYKGEYETTVHGAMMTMPAEHLLPVYVAMNPLQEKPVIDIAESIRQRDGFLHLIDIGANIGDTILVIDQRVTIDKVLAIEGSDRFYPYLERNAKRLKSAAGCTLEKIYLSDIPGQKNVAKSEDYGTGSLKVDPKGELYNFTTLDELITSKHPAVNWNLIKLDTDGFDFMIMRGARNFLSSSKTSVFFEFDPDSHRARNEDPIDIFSFLKSCGFTTLTFYNNWGEKVITLTPDDHNVIGQLIDYNTTYHRFHFDILAVKDKK